MGRAGTILFVLLYLVCAPATAGEIVQISTSYEKVLSTPDQRGMLDLILKEAFRRIGLEAEIVFTPNKRSLMAVNDGMLDGEINRIAGMEKKFPNLVQVPESNMEMHFVAFSNKDIPISGWESLRGLRIGIPNGWKILENKTKGFPNVTHLNSADDLFEMLELRRLDVVLYSMLNGHQKLIDLGYNDIYHLDPPLESKEMFLYLHNSHTDLKDPVADALRSMKRDGTYARIVNETTSTIRQQCDPHH